MPSSYRHYLERSFLFSDWFQFLLSHKHGSQFNINLIVIRDLLCVWFICLNSAILDNLSLDCCINWVPPKLLIFIHWSSFITSPETKETDLCFQCKNSLNLQLASVSELLAYMLRITCIHAPATTAKKCLSATVSSFFTSSSWRLENIHVSFSLDWRKRQSDYPRISFWCAWKAKP